MSEIIGKIKLVGETATFGAKGFRKRELVVTTTEEKYEQHISIDFVQDKCDELDSFKVGDQVKVGINIQGREWTNPKGEVKHFNSIVGWRIDKTDGESQESSQSHIPDNNDDGEPPLPF